MHNPPALAGAVLGELDTIGPDRAHDETTWQLHHAALLAEPGDTATASWLVPGVEYVLTYDPDRLGWRVRAAGWPEGLACYLTAGTSYAAELHLAPASRIGATRVHELDPLHAYTLAPAEVGWNLVQW